MRNAYNILIGKPQRKKVLEITRRTGEGNIKMENMKIGFDNADWIHVAQDKNR